MKYLTREIATACDAKLVGTGTKVATEAVTDHREIRGAALQVALPGKHKDGHEYVAAAADAGAVAALVHVSWEARLAPLADRIDLIVVDDVQAALWRLAQYHRARFAGLVLSITGSCGKTTTRAMLQAVLDAALGTGCATRGNQNNMLGTPLTVLRCNLEDAYLLAEIGTNAFGEIPALAGLVKPQVGIITGVMRAHLEGFGDVRGVLREKAALATAVPDTGAVVFPSYDDLLVGDRPLWRARTLTFGYRPGDTVQILEARESATVSGLVRLAGREAQVVLPLPGAFNLRNAAAALCVAHYLGLDVDKAIAALAMFKGESMRMEIRRVAGVTFLLDAYNANPDSMKCALDALAGFAGRRKAAALGAMLELGLESDALHREVAAYACGHRIDFLVALEGEGGPYGLGAAGAGTCGAFASAAGRKEASDLLLSWMKPGDVILLKGSRGVKVEEIMQNIEEGVR